LPATLLRIILLLMNNKYLQGSLVTGKFELRLRKKYQFLYRFKFWKRAFANTSTNVANCCIFERSFGYVLDSVLWTDGLRNGWPSPKSGSCLKIISNRVRIDAFCGPSGTSKRWLRVSSAFLHQACQIVLHYLWRMLECQDVLIYQPHHEANLFGLLLSDLCIDFRYQDMIRIMRSGVPRGG
jgi:hypothetical protein